MQNRWNPQIGIRHINTVYKSPKTGAEQTVQEWLGNTVLLREHFESLGARTTFRNGVRLTKNLTTSEIEEIYTRFQQRLDGPPSEAQLKRLAELEAAGFVDVAFETDQVLDAAPIADTMTYKSASLLIAQGDKARAILGSFDDEFESLDEAKARAADEAAAIHAAGVPPDESRPLYDNGETMTSRKRHKQSAA
jgi:hypothetical protein